MAKKRFFSGMTWYEDEYFRGLTSDQKVVYIFLITSPDITYYGVLKITPEEIADTTGVDQEIVEDTLKKFEQDDKIVRDKFNLIYVADFLRHQELKGLNKVTRDALLSNKYRLGGKLFPRIIQDFDGLIKSDSAPDDNPNDSPDEPPEPPSEPYSKPPLEPCSEYPSEPIKNTENRTNNIKDRIDKIEDGKKKEERGCWKAIVPPEVIEEHKRGAKDFSDIWKRLFKLK